MKVLILGADGYLGFPMCLYLSERGHDVYALDNLIKRKWEMQLEISPIQNLQTPYTRINSWKEITGKDIKWRFVDITKKDYLYMLIKNVKPDAVIHFAEQPSAPFSMISRGRAIETQTNNVMGTLNLLFAIKSHCPECHIIKLGTMGEYGTPNIDIEEGWLDVEWKGRKDRMLYPKKPGSFYHLSKVHDSANLEFACRIWNMAVTDLNQGIVYGTHTDDTQRSPLLYTSFHYDSIFGTVINRFLCQAALGLSLSVYGTGKQRRGFIHIRDTMRCIELALLNPAKPGEFRVFNQMAQDFSIVELAYIIQQYTGAQIEHIENPRIEQENHHYNVTHTALMDLGLKPTLFYVSIVDEMYEYIQKHKGNIKRESLAPNIKWKEK